MDGRSKRHFPHLRSAIQVKLPRWRGDGSSSVSNNRRAHVMDWAGFSPNGTILLETLAPWHSNRLSRLIKTPKLHIGDNAGVRAHLRLDAESLREDRQTLGQLVEIFVFQELRRQTSWCEDDVRLQHFRE